MANMVDYPPDMVDGFIKISALLTGFDAFELHSTGMAELYLRTVTGQIGADGYTALVLALQKAELDPNAIEDEVHRDLARAVTHLWYLAEWPPLEPSVHTRLGRQIANGSFIAAPQAYPEGLVWRTFGGHPSGAKAPGFGTWAAPPPGAPSIEDIEDPTVGAPAAGGAES
jgi:hypothetical protein